MRVKPEDTHWRHTAEGGTSNAATPQDEERKNSSEKAGFSEVIQLLADRTPRQPRQPNQPNSIWSCLPLSTTELKILQNFTHTIYTQHVSTQKHHTIYAQRHACAIYVYFIYSASIPHETCLHVCVNVQGKYKIGVCTYIYTHNTDTLNATEH